MKRSRFSERQIVGILKEGDAGIAVTEICRKYGISDQTYYNWKKKALVDFCKDRGIAIRYIQPGKPNQNGYVERFNKTYRDDVLNAHLFENLEQVREITAEWLKMYNEQRCHDALGGVPPTVFRERQTAKNSIYELST